VALLLLMLLLLLLLLVGMPLETQWRRSQGTA
jgi:hypothetical protein